MNLECSEISFTRELASLGYVAGAINYDVIHHLTTIEELSSPSTKGDPTYPRGQLQMDHRSAGVESCSSRMILSTMLSERFTDELEPRFHDDWTKFQLLITTVKIPFSPTSYPISSLHSFGFGDHVRASHSLIHWLFNNIELVHLQVTGHLGCKRRRARVPAGEPSLASRRETLRTRPYFVGDGRYARLPTRDE
ncbi:hypothetical protein MJO29_007123 [Puccinia striiformis f. sp. tritici]|nr:hypothetical protein MJO29_007123 [Puccinia striiformis f. sp. tritici]